MTIYLDDKPVELAGDNLDTLLSAAKDQLAPTGRVVVEVQIDGEVIAGNDLDQCQDAPASASELRLYSANPSSLAITTLQQIRELLEDARNAQNQAAELFQQDKQDEAMQQVVAAIGVWQQAQQVILQSVQLLNIDIESKSVDGQSVAEITNSLIEQISDLKDLLVSNDTVGLADVLAYEWPENINHWQLFITELIGWIENSDTNTNTET